MYNSTNLDTSNLDLTHDWRYSLLDWYYTTRADFTYQLGIMFSFRNILYSVFVFGVISNLFAILFVLYQLAVFYAQ